jgi:endonuclease/exonuclease/phosphatase (EEP) superfamily protein YafD
MTQPGAVDDTSTIRPPRRSLGRALRVLQLLLAAFVVVGTVLPLSHEPYWWIRVFDFPRLQLIVLGALVLVSFTWQLGRPGRAQRSHAVWSVLLGAALIYQSWRLWPYTALHPVESVRAEAPAEARSFRLVVSNVLMDNRNAAHWLAEVQRVAPDLVLMLEPDGWWVEQVQVLRDTLPYTVEHPLDNTYGIALYSRFPLHEPVVREVVEVGIPSIWGSFELPAGDRVQFAFVHPRPPRVAEDTDERDAELVLVAREFEGHDGPALVAGDFNDVAWSDTTTLFQRISGLLDPRIGRGLYSTYHAQYPLLRWPVDYAFHSEHLALVELRRLAAAGSDHFGILVALAVTPTAPAQQDEPDAGPRDRAQAAEILEEVRD